MENYKMPNLKLVGGTRSEEQEDEETFVLCPKVLLQGLSDEQVNEMKQLYRYAYEKAVKKTQGRSGYFSNGGGI